ncbi:hypothetical protein ABFY48_16070 [Lysinibacillus pakistanensis]|uniref:hypothetical protein n=1 Tax=Lysinibacillus pakistanensis TaxID=759811 RepID=UPI003D2880C4
MLWLTDYTRDGVKVSAKIEEKIIDPDEMPYEPIETIPTIEEMQTQTLLNKEVLLAMKEIGM